MSLKSLKIALLLVLTASVLVGALLWLNVSRLTRKFAQQQISGLTLGEVSIGWDRVKLTNFRYQSGESVVASIDARSVDAHPTFLSFLKDEIEVRDLVIKSPQFHLVKRPDETPQPGPATTGTTPRQARGYFKKVTLEDGRGEIEDRTVSGAPARLILDQINVLLEDLRYPVVAGATTVDASCVIKGQPDGKAHLAGWLDSVNKSAELRLDSSGVDLKNLRPYLRNAVREIENADGTADLQMELVMTNGAYTATGQLVLGGLHLPRSDQSRPSIPTFLLTQYLKLHRNRVTIPFKVTGDVRKKEHRLDLSALLSGMINQELGNEALQKKIGLPKNPERLEKDLRRLKERAKELKKLF